MGCDFRKIFLFLFFLLAIFSPLYGQNFSSPWESFLENVGPGVSFLLMDFTSGRVLAFKEADQSHALASVTKVMSLFVLYEALSKHPEDFDALVSLSPRSSFRVAPKQSSLMFLESSHHVRVHELLRGLAVSSGNDASIALSEWLDGSVPWFVHRMNQLSLSLGLRRTHFVEPSGISPFNRSTAWELALLARAYVQRYPQALVDLHSLPDFVYPTERNTDVRDRYFRIQQNNRNGLLQRYPGADGIKTGYIEESGYNLLATAQRDQRRLIALVLGVRSDRQTDGDQKRLHITQQLFDYGFSQTNLYHFVSEVPQYPLLFGKDKEVTLRASGVLTLALRPEERQKLVTAFTPRQRGPALATEQELVGWVDYCVGIFSLGRQAVYVPIGTIPKNSWWDKVLHSLYKWYLG